MQAKTLKLSITIILVLMMIISIPAAASAEEVNIEELSMTLTVPDEGYILTRGMDIEDPVFDELNIDPVEMAQILEETYIHLVFLDTDPYYEVAITKFEYPSSIETNTYANLSVKELEQMAAYYISLDQGQIAQLLGIDEAAVPSYNFTSFEIETVGNTNYIVYEYWLMVESGEIFCRQYNTIINGYAVDITLKSYGQIIRDDVSEIFTDIVASVKFSDPPPVEEESNNIANIILIVIVLVGSITVVAIVLTRQKKFKQQFAEELAGAAREREEEKQKRMLEAQNDDDTKNKKNKKKNK